MWQFTADTPIWVYILVTSMAGLGMGAIPTVNTVVAQAVVPKNLLGVAVGALFFFQMVGIAVAPSIMGLVQSTSPDLERGLQLVLLTNAIALTLSLLIIVVSPEIPLDSE